MADFFEQSADDPDSWARISSGGIQRVNQRYTWKLYAERLMTLSRIYGFWKYVTNLEREETRRYLEMFYNLQFRPLAEGLRARGHRRVAECENVSHDLKTFNGDVGHQIFPLPLAQSGTKSASRADGRSRISVVAGVRIIALPATTRSLRGCGNFAKSDSIL